jgi:AcrR family transcriptional regulator
MTTEHSASGHIDRSLELLWRMRDTPARGPKPTLSLDQITTTAVQIADAEGLDAVSMRRVAAELNVGTMSLYRYVPGKAELLELMLDNVDQCLDDSKLDGLDWREHLETCARGAWHLYLAHPWLVNVDRSRPLLGPNGLAGFDQFLGGIDDIGLTDQERIAVIAVIDGFTSSLARSHVNAQAAEQRSGISDAEFWKAQEPVLIKAMQTGNYPQVAALAEDAFGMPHEELFEFGLARILDGLEQQFRNREHTE